VSPISVTAPTLGQPPPPVTMGNGIGMTKPMPNLPLHAVARTRPHRSGKSFGAKGITC